MGGKSKSSADNTQNTQEVVTTLGDNRVTDTGNIGGNVQTGETAGDVNVTTTDFGAIESGQEVSLAALDFGGDAVEGGFDLAGEAIVSSQDITEQAIDLTGNTFAGALNAINTNSRFFQEQTGQTVDRALAFATRSNTSEGTQILQDGLKFVAIVAGIFGAVVVLKGLKS